MSIKVVHINSIDIVGGAARAAYRLHSSGATAGFSSSMFVQKRASNDPSVAVLTKSTNMLIRFIKRLRKNRFHSQLTRYAAKSCIDYDYFTEDRSIYGKETIKQLPQTDIINLHWIAGFVDYGSFFPAIARKEIPVIWTLHDMNPFTGGCHYDRDCGRFTENCGRCPQLKSCDTQDISRKIFLRKQRAFASLSSDKMHIVTPSRWLADEARRSLLLSRFQVSVIPNGLDTKVFSPKDRRLARETFGLPLDSKIVLFVAGSLNDVRKGLNLLKDAIAQMPDIKNMLLVSVGKASTDFFGEMKHKSLGKLEDDELLALAYSAADLFVIPSLQDNLPNTVIESLSCGTPVVGFEVGGVPDMIQTGVTGILVPKKDISALGCTITQLLNQPDRLAEMSRNCRRIAVSKYDSEIQGYAYFKYYKKILKINKSSHLF